MALSFPGAVSPCNPECLSGGVWCVIGFIVKGSHGRWLLAGAWAWLCTHSPKTALLATCFRVFSRLMSKVLVFFLCLSLSFPRWFGFC